MTRPVIMVVDDDDGMRDLLSLLLGEAGYDVVTAEDGVVAMELLEHSIPAGIVLDLMMPRASGWDVWDWMQLRPALVDVPVIFWTASGISPNAISRARLMPKGEPRALVAAVTTMAPLPV